MEKNTRLLNLSLMLAGFVPAAICLVIASQMLWVIWPDLTIQQIDSLLAGLVLTLGGAFSISLIAFFLWRRNQTAGTWLLIALPLGQLGALFVYVRYLQVALPVREWLFDHDLYMTLLLSGIIPVFYATLLYLAAVLRIRDRKGLVKTVIAAVVIPVIVYVGFNVLRFSRLFEGSGQVMNVVLVSLSVVFTVVMLRLMLYVGQRNSGRLNTAHGRFILRLVFVGVLPLVGLLLNSLGPVARESRNVLGDFTGYTFWALAIGNGILYLLPDFTPKYLRIFLSALRAAGFFFVLYFCAVFLLYLPLALLLVAAIGLGLLLLIPYFAGAVQLLRIRDDWRILADSAGKKIATLTLTGGFLLLPAIVLMHMASDRSLLTQAIAFVTHPPLGENSTNIVASNKIERFTQLNRLTLRGWRNQDNQIPIYDSLYRKIVFDGFDLSESLRQRLRAVFLGESETTQNARRSPFAPARIEITGESSHPSSDFTATELKLRIRNDDTKREAELDTLLSLPEGAYLTGHWLTIDGQEVEAQITTKSSALWTYNRVTEQRRDPSLIWYAADNLLRWKVYPVPAAGYREARIRLTHFFGGNMKLGDKSITLTARHQVPQAVASTNGKMQIVAADTSQKTIRKPYLHFIADCSRNALSDYPAMAQRAARQLGIGTDTARFSLVNTSMRTGTLTRLEDLQCPGAHDGFFLDMALRALIMQSHAKTEPAFPVFVILSARPPQAEWTELSYFLPWYTDIPVLVHADAKGTALYNFQGKRVAEQEIPVAAPVRLIGGHYYSARTTRAHGSAPKRSMFIDGGEQHFNWLLGQNDARVLAVRTAIQANVLNPATGSIVLETEAQRRKLAEMHKRTLNARNELDTGDRPRMSEPRLWLMLAVLMPLLAWFERRREHRVF